MGNLQFTPEQIQNWVGRHFDYHRRRNGQEITICNPFDGDTKFKFNINTLKGVCHDWRPGHQHWDGPFIRFVQKYRKISFHEALREVLGEGVDLRAILRALRAKEVVEEEPEIVSIKLPQAATPFRDPSKNSKATVLAWTYLATRGIDPDTAIKYDLHYTADRIFFPYYEYGVLAYWQSRSINGKIFDFPALDEVGVGKESFLYGFDMVEPGGTMIVVESIICSISLSEGATASGGAGMGKTQATKIRALNPKTVILAPDADFEGLMSIQANAALIEGKVDARILFAVPPHPYKDWNQMWQHQPRAYIDKHAIPVTPVNIHKRLQIVQAVERKQYLS